MIRIQKNQSKSYEMNMTTGPLFQKIVLFGIPLMLSGILQLLFNAADMIVAGRFIGSLSLAAIGSTSSLIHLFINIFLGLSVGSSVIVGHFYGANSPKDVEETVHTAIYISLLSGVFLAIAGYFATKPLLLLMGTPEDVLASATIYMQVYFLGMPVMLLYNFGSAILRAVGDTRRPLYYLLLAGVINVILNIIFIVVFKMGVAGVALATVLSQIVSALLILRCLTKQEGMVKLTFSKLKIWPDKLKSIARVGLPAGLQGAIFSVSNVLIQSSINQFGSIAMAGSTATANLEGFVYTAMNSFYQTSLSFTSQNHGAKNYARIKKILLYCLLLVFMIGGLLSLFVKLNGSALLSLYNTDPEVIAFGLLRLNIIFSTYFLCGMMDVVVGSLRGMGYSMIPMIVSLLGACGFRILWILFVFPHFHTLPSLFIVYPISWSITLLAHSITFFIAYQKKKTPQPYSK